MFRQNRWLVLAIVSSALFLIIIDMTVLYTALPRLTHDLGATTAEKLWIVNAYPLVVAGLLPGAGLLSDRLGHKRLFLAGLPLFGLASLCAAFAPSAAALIAARAGLAVGAALMMPATLSIVRHVFQDERERALAIGIWASVASAGAALGPVVGGVLLEFFWWGSVFLINVPVVAIALLLALPAIPACGGQSRRPWDALGSLQVMFGLVGVVYAIKELSARAPDFGLAVLAALGGMLCLYLFVRRQRRAREPMIDFALFRNRRFARGVAVALVATMALVGMELVFSQHLQLVQGLTPLKAGLFVLPIPLASLVVGPLAGWLVPRWGENRVMCASLLLGSAGLLGLALSYQSATGAQLASLVLLGVGFGGAMTAASTAVMLNVDEQSSGMAAAIEDVSYELGGVIGVTLLGSLMSLVYGMSLRLPSVPSCRRGSATASTTPCWSPRAWRRRSRRGSSSLPGRLSTRPSSPCCWPPPRCSSSAPWRSCASRVRLQSQRHQHRTLGKFDQRAGGVPGGAAEAREETAAQPGEEHQRHQQRQQAGQAERQGQAETHPQHPRQAARRQVLGDGLAEAAGARVGRGQEQQRQAAARQPRSQRQQPGLALAEQRRQGGELQQQDQYQDHHRHRAAARVLHDRQGPLAVAQPADPGVRHVGQAVQVQRAAQRHPQAQQQGCLQQRRRTVERPRRGVQHDADQHPDQWIAEHRAAELFRRRHRRQAHRQAGEELQGDQQ